MFLNKILSIQFPYMEIIWLAFFDGDKKNFQIILKICPKKFFCFFSTATQILYANKHFPKKFFFARKI